jgi:hypothetical protein
LAGAAIGKVGTSDEKVEQAAPPVEPRRAA